MNASLLLLLAVFICAPLGVRAEEEVVADEPAVEAVVDESAPEVVELGNKICPVSGEKVGEMGKVETIEYKGKKINLCCAMCKKDFEKDPEAFLKKAEEIAEAETVAARE